MRPQHADLDRFLSIPFVDGGRDFSGCDCWGLVRLWYREMLGIQLDAYDGVGARDAASIDAMIERDRNDWIKVDEPREHDVAVMRSFANPRLEGHLGIVMPRRMLFHTTESPGPHLVRLSDPLIKPRILEFRRHRQCPTQI